MELEATRELPADRDTVWRALNDPEVLRRCIPGCDSLERGEDGSLAAKVVAKVGPVSAKFAGTVTLHDLVPPESYRLAFQGQGGAAGFAKGEAWVRLDAAEGGGTTMHYRSKASVGGKLAQVGARLVDASARKLADDFFERFAAEVAVPAAVAVEAPAAVEAGAPPAAVAEGGPGAGAAGAPSVGAPSPAPAPVRVEPGSGRIVGWIVGAAVVLALAWWLLA